MDAHPISPLEDITVVELSQVLAGPFATMTLGDFGADVIKLEAPNRGDRSRNIEPIPDYFDSANRNKKSVVVDLKSSTGQERVKELLRSADVFVESTKPGRIEEYGLSYQEVADVNDQIIYCSISGFGSNSPYQNVPAWDILIQAMSGIMSITGAADGPPVWSGFPSGDIAASMYVVQSVFATLYAQRTGQLAGSEYIEVPMLDSAISWLTLRAGHVFGTGEPYPRGNHHPKLAPFGVFSCGDDQLVIAATTSTLWESLCETLDGSGLGDDPRFQTQADRVANRNALVEEINGILAEHPVDYWVERMHENEVPAAPIHDTKSVWDDEHVKRHELRQTMPREGRKDATVVDHPVTFENLGTSLRTPPPSLGEHTNDYLSGPNDSD